MQPEEHAASSFPTCRVSGYKPTRGSKYWTCKFSVQGNLMTTKLSTSSWCLCGSEVNCCVYHSTRHQNTLLRCYTAQQAPPPGADNQNLFVAKAVEFWRHKCHARSAVLCFHSIPSTHLKGKSNEKRLLPSSLLASRGNISALFRKWCKPVHSSVKYQL